MSKITASKQTVDRLQKGKELFNEVSDNPLRTLSVHGQGEVECLPDIFQMTITLNSSKPSIGEAEASIKKRSDYILQVLRNNGMGEDCIKSYTDISHDNQAIVLKTTLSVTSSTTGLTKAKRTIQEKLNSSVQCSSINCSVSFNHLMSQREESFRLAVVNAKSKGISVSTCLGVELGPVLTLTEENQQEVPLSDREDQRSGTCDQQYLNSIVIISCYVSAVFELYISDNNKSNLGKF